MKRTLILFTLLAVSLSTWSAASSVAQDVPSTDSLHQQLKPFRTNATLPDPQSIGGHVADGKLKLSLHDAVQLMLLNNTEVRLNQLSFQRSVFNLQRSFSPFDPLLTSSFSPQRSTSPTASTLSGATTLSNLNQSTAVGLSELFAPGTTFGFSFNTSRSVTNSSFTTFNPSINSAITFQLSQPLLKGRGVAVTRGPITIARRNVKQSQANFTVQINDSILSVINQYWSLVQAQKDLSVLQASLKLADESYKRDKRALELGAISPLDIYRSEATVAQRRLGVLQAEYAIKPLEDQLRRTLGIDLDLQHMGLDLELTESLNEPGDQATMDIAAATELAFSHRPELT